MSQVIVQQQAGHIFHIRTLYKYVILYVLYIEIWLSEKTRSKALAKELASFSFIKIRCKYPTFSMIQVILK